MDRYTSGSINRSQPQLDAITFNCDCIQRVPEALADLHDSLIGMVAAARGFFVTAEVPIRGRLRDGRSTGTNAERQN
jgi:hypothetical protein